MIRTPFLDLDVLDSPVISVNSPASVLSSWPGSSTAEKIFNDPHSWLDSNDTSVAEREAMAWLTDELQKYDDRPVDEIELSPIEQGVKLQHLSEQYKRTPKPTIAFPSVSGLQKQWEGVLKDDDHPFLPLPIFERSGLDLSMDLNIRLSNIWEGSASHPSPIIFSPPSSPSTGQSVKFPTTTRTDVPPLDLVGQSEGSSITPLTSPVAVLSASTTWSILELYGVRPETPDSGRPLIGSHPPLALLPVPPVARLLASGRTTPPPRIVTPGSSVAARVASEAALIRPLPVIPDSVQESPTPSPVKTPEPRSRKPLKPSLLSCQPSNPSPSPPTMKIPQVSKTPPSYPSNASPVTRSKYPSLSRKFSGPIGPQLSDNSHSPATPRMKTAELTRFISLPLPSAWLSPPQSISPSAPPEPHPSRPCSATRSPPPLGPRPRSTTVPSRPQ